MLIDEIKKIVIDYIHNIYEKFLNDNNKLLLDHDTLYTNIHNMYETQTNEIKIHIRNNLKNIYKENYPSASVENIILDIFQDKNLNINKTVDELKLIQNKNYIELNLPIINNSMNINISFLNNFIIINTINKEMFDNDIIEILEKYKFLYSINDIILDEIDNNNKIDIIKKQIDNEKFVKIGLYHLKE